MIVYNPEITHPWWSGGAVKVVEDFLKTYGDESKVIEFGSGQSSKWLAERCTFFLTVEDNNQWVQRVTVALNGYDHAAIIHRKAKSEYVEVLGKQPPKIFWLTVVDGIHRNECMDYAQKLTLDTGIILVDDAEAGVYQPGQKRLQAAGWIPEDFRAVEGDKQRKDKITRIYRRE